MQASKGDQSKNKLIECAAKLFLQKGYNATGINDILHSTQMPKGSFYFHFKSKKDLAIEVAKYYDAKINKWISDTAKGREWEVFVTALISEMIKNAECKEHFGCPFAVLGLEIAFVEPDISEYYSESMKKIIDIFTKVLEFSGIASNRAYLLANRVFAVYEGYLLYFRISKDTDNLKMLLKDLIAIYKDYIKGEKER